MRQISLIVGGTNVLLLHVSLPENLRNHSRMLVWNKESVVASFKTHSDMNDCKRVLPTIFRITRILWEKIKNFECSCIVNGESVNISESLLLPFYQSVTLNCYTIQIHSLPFSYNTDKPEPEAYIHMKFRTNTPVALDNSLKNIPKLDLCYSATRKKNSFELALGDILQYFCGERCRSHFRNHNSEYSRSGSQGI